MVALVAAAVSANAASYQWSAPSGRLFDGQGSATANRYAGTGYLFAAGTVAQADIVAGLLAGTLSTTLGSTLAQNTFTAGRASDNSAVFDATGLENAYFVVLGKDKDGNDGVYISDYAAIESTDVGAGTVTFGSQNAYSAAFKDATAGYAGAGWYSASAVPEPTSGLLLLLGVAGLALKRKRA
jgi:hypothetical protein